MKDAPVADSVLGRDSLLRQDAYLPRKKSEQDETEEEDPEGRDGPEREVFPDPVGPVTRIRPYARCMVSFTHDKFVPSRPSSSKLFNPASGSRTRMATFSPKAVGKVETRKSMVFSSMVVENLPSWGILISSILRFAKIFTRETMAW